MRLVAIAAFVMVLNGCASMEVLRDGHRGCDEPVPFAERDLGAVFVAGETVYHLEDGSLCEG